MMKLKTAIVTLIITAIAIIVYIETKQSQPNSKANAVTLAIKKLENTIETANDKTIEIIIKKNATLTNILQQQHISTDTAYQITNNPLIKKYLSQLAIGKTITLTYNNNQQIIALSYPLNNKKQLYLKKESNKITTSIIPIPLETETTFKSGTIKDSFAGSAKQEGIPSKIIYNFEKIFQGSINFKHQVRPGDRFKLLYKTYYNNDKVFNNSNILLAEYQHNNNGTFAIYFKINNSHAGYYNLQGKSVEPLFLNTPLHYKRISSRFSYHRLDPITHKIQPHYGVDYAAASGTPVKSVGNGRVVFKGYSRGYGNNIKIRYNKKIVALYAHLSRFAKIRYDQTVKQGQIIGYVGMTGWATGPHLHFGWYVNDRPTDPLKRKHYTALPIPKKDMPRFIAMRNNLLKHLDQYQKAHQHA